MPEENVELVRGWVRALNEDDLDASLACCDPAFEMLESRTLPGAARVSGLDELRSYSLGWRRNWSEWEWREEKIVDVPPDRVVLVATLWLRGLRSGADVERRWAYVFTVRGGKLLSQVGYDSEAEALEAASARE
ncbi:MAG: nuclear transport factor 2 family protein [Thermoleophilaceae bacterium]